MSIKRALMGSRSRERISPARHGRGVGHDTTHTIEKLGKFAFDEDADVVRLVGIVHLRNRSLREEFDHTSFQYAPGIWMFSSVYIEEGLLVGDQEF